MERQLFLAPVSLALVGYFHVDVMTRFVLWGLADHHRAAADGFWVW